jgi:hypothetical protein
MALQNPLVVYDAATNAEAQMLKLLLIEAGIEAFVSEDLSPGGLWMFGLLPGIHKPQVWVSQAEVDEAHRILEGYERQAAERRQRNSQQGDSSPIKVLCEECGQASLFPSTQRGSVQYCPRCGAYVDVDEAGQSDVIRPRGGGIDEP